MDKAKLEQYITENMKSVFGYALTCLLYTSIPVSALSSLGFRRSIERHARAFCLPLLFLTVIMLTVFLPILSSVQTAAAVLLCLFSLILSLSHCKSSCTAFFGAWLRTAAMLILVSSMLLGLFGACLLYTSSKTQIPLQPSRIF